MRLKPEESSKLAKFLTEKIFSDPANSFKVPRADIERAIESSMKKHFEEEAKLDKDAENLLLQKRDEFAGLQRQKALSMIRRQLAEERNFVLSGGAHGRFSEDKISHLSHLVADRLFDDDLMDFADEDEGAKFVKRVFTAYFKAEDDLNDKVRKKIASLSSAPLEGSPDWEVLFRKYKEEELRRMNHS
jgi:hypothetical protein